MDFHPSVFFCRHDCSTLSTVTQPSLSQATSATVFSTDTNSQHVLRLAREGGVQMLKHLYNFRQMPWLISVVPPFSRRLDPELKLCVEVSPATSNFSSQSLELALPPS